MTMIWCPAILLESLLRLGEQLLELLLGKLRLRLSRAGSYWLGGAEGLLLLRLLLLLEKLRVLLGLLRLEKLLRLLRLLGGKLSKVLLRLLSLWLEKLLRLLGLLRGELRLLLLGKKMSRQRIYLTVLVVIARESLQSDLLSSQL